MIDVWDQSTWKDLRVLRTELREALFDCTDPKTEASLQAQLNSVQDDIEQGLTVQVPF